MLFDYELFVVGIWKSFFGFRWREAGVRGRRESDDSLKALRENTVNFFCKHFYLLNSMRFSFTLASLWQIGKLFTCHVFLSLSLSPRFQNANNGWRKKEKRLLQIFNFYQHSTSHVHDYDGEWISATRRKATIKVSDVCPFDILHEMQYSSWKLGAHLSCTQKRALLLLLTWTHVDEVENACNRLGSSLVHSSPGADAYLPTRSGKNGA